MTTKPPTTPRSESASLSRRTLLIGSAGVGLTIIRPELVRGTDANSKLRLGLIGCGDRGPWIAKLFQQHGGYRFIATADYFAQRAAKAAETLGVPATSAFAGLSGYRCVLDAKPDAVVIESTPYFHPEQAMAAVEAGCHLFCAKPVAVDVPGCLTVAAAGRKATASKLCLLVDFQTRANEFYQEAVRRVHAGDIGPVVTGETAYYCGGPEWLLQESLRLDPGIVENRMRMACLDRILSGDIITEQNIHVLDVATWLLDAAPIKAVGTCSKRGRNDNGTNNDHFSVLFTFPNDVTVSFISKQFGYGSEEIGCCMFGPRGTVDTHYYGLVCIRGQKSYKGGRLTNLYTDGVVQNIADFHRSITRGDFSNPSVVPSGRSNLTTILGRMAAYRKAETTWEEMMKTAEKLEFPTSALKS